MFIVRVFAAVIALLAVHISSSEGKFRSYQGYFVHSISDDEENLKKMHNYFEESMPFSGAIRNGSMFLDLKRDELSILSAPEYLHNLQEVVKVKKLHMKLVNDDFSKIIERDRKTKLSNRKFSWDAYYDVDDIYKYLRSVNSKHPESTSVVVGGQSYEKRDILGLRIVTSSGDNEAKPSVFIESGIHAREWIAPATTTFFIDQLLNSKDEKIVKLRNKFDWHIFPTVNPDGYHYTFTEDRMWRKTRSKSPNGCYGADANRNWDHNWMNASSSNDPCNYDLYAGSKAFSEIETKSLSQYVSNITNLLAYIGYHSTAQMLLLPYSDFKKHYDNYDDLVKIGTTSLKYGEAVNGVTYEGPGTAAEILYAVSGGSMDWVREKLKTKLVFTYELRGKNFEWPPEKIPEQGNEVTQMLLGLFTKAEEMGYC